MNINPPLAQEIFDVVDEFDQVIDQQPRAQVHRLGLRHRAVHLLVFNPGGALLLQLRSSTKDCCPGLWDSSVSGHLDAGESYDHGVRRECAEELGIHLENTPQRLFKLPASAATGMEFCWVYRTEAQGPFVLQTEEIAQTQWFSPQHLSAVLQQHPQQFTPTLRLIWHTLQQQPQSPLC